MKRKRDDDNDDDNRIKKRKEFLSIVNRKVLDFDQVKICSLSLKSTNVFVCLSCGKYLHGTPAFLHSLSESHPVFIHVETKKIYVIPDNVELTDPTLDDIKYNLQPEYALSDIISLNDPLERNKRYSDIHNKPYLPGLIGMNNIKDHSGINVILQLLARCSSTLRDFFLRYECQSKTPFVNKVGEMTRKVWSKRSFKSIYNPNDLIQNVSRLSGGKFSISNGSDPREFFVFCLALITKEMKENYPTKKKMIRDLFQGKLNFWKETIINDDLVKKKIQQLKQRQKIISPEEDDLDLVEREEKVVRFSYLTLEIPAEQVMTQGFDTMEDNQPKQVIIPIQNLLKKFDGNTVTMSAMTSGDVEKKSYKIIQFPKILVLHFNRFMTNKYFKEKQTTIVSFPLVLDMTPYLYSSSTPNPQKQKKTIYELVANIIHEGEMERKISSMEHLKRIKKKNEEEKISGQYKIQLRDGNKWFELSDVNVMEVMVESIRISESYMLFYRMKE